MIINHVIKSSLFHNMQISYLLVYHFWQLRAFHGWHFILQISELFLEVFLISTKSVSQEPPISVHKQKLPDSNEDIPSLPPLSSAVASADLYQSCASQDPLPDFKNLVSVMLRFIHFLIIFLIVICKNQCMLCQHTSDFLQATASLSFFLFSSSSASFCSTIRSYWL